MRQYPEDAPAQLLSYWDWSGGYRHDYCRVYASWILRSQDAWSLLATEEVMEVAPYSVQVYRDLEENLSVRIYGTFA